MHRILLSTLLIAPLVHASPIPGGLCGGTGTLAEFIGLGDVGCKLSHGDRIYDISISLPAPADLSTFLFDADSDGFAFNTAYSEATARFFPINAALTLRWDSPAQIVRAEWYQFDATGNLSVTPLSPTKTGAMTMQATIANAYLGFQLQQIPPPEQLFDPGTFGDFPDFGNGHPGVPEPSAFFPLLGIGLLWILRDGVRNSSSR